MTLTRCAIVLLLLLKAAANTSVQADAGEPSNRQYLLPGVVNSEALIAPPPTVGSPEFEKQMAIVLWLQKTRTAEQVAFAELALDVERFAPLLGNALFAVDAVALKSVIDSAVDEVRQEYDAIKSTYDYPRPFQVNDAVDPVGDARPVASYPSGHAIRAIVYARLLSEVFPDRRDALLELAYQVGFGRVIAGVHYPVDVLSGQILGNAYADAIVNNSAFIEMISRIRGD